MKKINKIMKISDIIYKKELSPRSFDNNILIQRYYDSLKLGVTFPPITLALFNKKYIIVDGFHRWRAFKRAGLEHIQSEILIGLNEREIYLEAVKRNLIHGEPLTAYEKRSAYIKLEKYGYTREEISEIIKVPVDRFDRWEIHNIKKVGDDKFVLKTPLKHLSQLPTKDNLKDNQYDISGGFSQLDLLRTLNKIISNGYLNFNDDEVIRELTILKDLIGKLSYSQMRTERI